MPRAAVFMMVAASCAALSGCATSHALVMLPSGVTVETFRRAYTNVHVVTSGSNRLMVDAGEEAEAESLESDLIAAGISPSSLRAIVLTHGHADHAGGARYFQQKYHVPVVVGRGDVALLGEGRNDTLCPVGWQAEHDLEEYQNKRFTRTTADVTLDGPTDLEPLAGLAGRIVPLPGHTAGSLVVVLPGGALVGDLFRGGIASSSAEVHFYMCDLAANRRSVRQLLDVEAKDAAVFFSGHFGPIDRDSVEDRFPPAGP